MLIKEISIADIDVKNRLRPVTLEAVKGLAGDIAKRGLRQPIEVAAQTRGTKYRLVAGAHRLEACKLAGMQKIPAFVVTGTNVDLRRAEILENLARNELSALERAQFLAEFKLLYQEAHPDAKNGGDRTQEQFASLANWHATVAMRSQSSVRTVERYSAIGARLDHKAAEALRGSEVEDSLKELESLARLTPDMQIAVADRLTAAEGAARTVAAAVKIIDGHVDPTDAADHSEKHLKKLKESWARADGKTRAQFIAHLRDIGALESADG